MQQAHTQKLSLITEAAHSTLQLDKEVKDFSFAWDSKRQVFSR